MLENGNFFLMLGPLLLIGVIADYIGRHSPFPRVSVLLLAGFAAGPSMFNLLSESVIEKVYPLLTDSTLIVIGFLLGKSLSLKDLKASGRKVLSMSLAVAVMTALAVCSGLYFLDVPLQLAVLYAAIAPSTDPAATVDVVHESGTHSPFSKVLLGITAIDDAWGLIIFSLLLVIAKGVGGVWHAHIVLEALRDVGGGIVLGLFLGGPMSILTEKIRTSESTLVESFGMLFLCGGLAMHFEFSFILAAMTMGAVVINRSEHYTRPFREVERLEWPMIVLFFFLAGASMHLGAIVENWAVIAIYIGFRVIGRVVGAFLGALISNMNKGLAQWMGISLMPQAGVAMGMALVAAHNFPEYSELVSVVVAATVFFEILGPFCTSVALKVAGDRAF